jgi:fatty-acyl-CoA synthase
MFLENLRADYLLTKRAYLSPHQEALIELSTGESYDFSQLNARSNGAAHFLRNFLKVNKGDRISILAYNCMAYIDLFYGVSKIGAVFAPLNWRLAERELTAIIDDCRPRVLFFGPEFVEQVAHLSSHITVEHYVSLGKTEIEWAFFYEDELLKALSIEPEHPPLDGNDPYCILYTSGTTDRPKGVIVPHRQVLYNCINTAVSWALRPKDISPVFTPLFHAGGLFAFLTPLFYIGGKVVLVRSFDSEESLKVIEKYMCTVVLGVPTVFQMWLATPDFRKRDFSNVRWFISGGAPCSVSLINRWRQATATVLRQGYGLTEAGVNCFTITNEESLKKPGSVGKPMFHSEMKIVDSKGLELPKGQVGELLISGPHVFRGYWNNLESTNQALQNGWLHTGDMARCDDEGFFFIVGRYKDMIISGGENIYAAEVETVFREHPSVADTALVGKPDEKWGETGVMFVVLNKGQTATEDELLAFCRHELASYKIPKKIIFTHSLPYSSYGKVKKSELKKIIEP